MKRRSDRKIFRGLIVGFVAGFAASFAMEVAQQYASKAGLQPASDDDPATVKLAERFAGHAIPKDEKSAAGSKVHYAFGGVLGVLYGIAVEFEPRVAAGFGLAYGTAAAVTADEVAVPLMGLAEPPWRVSGSTHLFSLASHLVFGAALESTRRALLWIL